MNAGGHGRETAEVLQSARIVDLLGDGLGADRPVGDLALGYRTSVVGPADVVVSATFTVAPDDPRRVRRSHQRHRALAP